MRYSPLLLPFAAFGLAGCVQSAPAPQPTTTTVVMPPTTSYVAPPASVYVAPMDTTTTTSRQWTN
jgi:hypothetical protein